MAVHGSRLIYFLLHFNTVIHFLLNANNKVSVVAASKASVAYLKTFPLRFSNSEHSVEPKAPSLSVYENAAPLCIGNFARQKNAGLRENFFEPFRYQRHVKVKQQQLKAAEQNALNGAEQSEGISSAFTSSITNERDYREMKLSRIRAHNIEPFPTNFSIMNATIKEILEKHADLAPGEIHSHKFYTIAGRILSIRNNGMFIDVGDAWKRLQVYCDKCTTTYVVHPYAKIPQLENKAAQVLLKHLDSGDFIAVTGFIRKTLRGEITLHCVRLELIGKALAPLPDKFKGLKNLEIRYRQRQMDLLINKDSRNTLITRFRCISFIRQYMENLGFLEVETPMLHSVAGGAIARPFTTQHNVLDANLYLRISPELFLKRLIIGGLSEKIFELNRCFRNEGVSAWHNPEFTTLEAYQAYANYEVAINLTENLVRDTLYRLKGTDQCNFQGIPLQFRVPWPRLSMVSLILQYTGMNFSSMSTTEALQAAEILGVGNVTDMVPSWGHIIEKVFEAKVQQFLIQPIHVTHLPVDVSPLAAVLKNDPRLSERFESFVLGKEIANGYSELNDPVEQRRRFVTQVKFSKNDDVEHPSIDYDYLLALEQGLPPTCGLGIGIDRMAMIFTNSSSIRDVIAFPTLRESHREY